MELRYIWFCRLVPDTMPMQYLPVLYTDRLRVMKKDLKVRNSGCHVGSVAIPPPPTEPIVTLLPMDIGSGEQPTTIILPPVRRNRRYTVTYRGILARATAVWRRRRGWSS